MRRSGLTLAFAVLLFASATADGRETGSIDPPAAPGAFGKAWVASFWMGGKPPPPPVR